MAQTELLLAVVSALTRLCGASPPAAAELFCEGALGAWVRLAQRRVAKQPLADREGLAALLLKDGLRMVEAFSLAVPQASAQPSASTSELCSFILQLVLQVQHSQCSSLRAGC